MSDIQPALSFEERIKDRVRDLVAIPAVGRQGFWHWTPPDDLRLEGATA